VNKEDAYGKTLPGRLSGEQRTQLLSRLVNRAHNEKVAGVPRGQSVSTPKRVRKEKEKEKEGDGVSCSINGSRAI
jgi:hypothetical protein